MIGVVAQIKVKAGTEAEFEAIAGELVAHSREEAGCLEYGLWRMAEAGQYAFIERYTDEAAVEAHRKSDHFRRLGRQMGGLMEGPPAVMRLAPV